RITDELLITPLVLLKPIAVVVSAELPQKLEQFGREIGLVLHFWSNAVEDYPKKSFYWQTWNLSMFTDRRVAASEQSLTCVDRLGFVYLLYHPRFGTPTDQWDLAAIIRLKGLHRCINSSFAATRFTRP